MRLGAPIFDKYTTPDEWVRAVKKLGYGAAYCPVGLDADEVIIKDYEKAARDADVVIAEVGSWCNPISPIEEERKSAVEKCKRSLALADRIGARCCVNIAGSRGEDWDGHHPDNLTDGTFDLIVETVRDIIDSVKPTRTYYTLEPMPWMYPDSADNYVMLLRAIDRDAFAVHFDPVNIVVSPQIYYNTGAMIRDFVSKLGGKIRSCHAKDIILTQDLTVHLNEIRPGLGNLDYATYLREINRLDPDTPLMVEHLSSREEYDLAVAHIRSVADANGLSFL